MGACYEINYYILNSYRLLYKITTHKTHFDIPGIYEKKNADWYSWFLLEFLLCSLIHPKILGVKKPHKKKSNLRENSETSLKALVQLDCVTTDSQSQSDVQLFYEMHIFFCLFILKLFPLFLLQLYSAVIKLMNGFLLYFLSGIVCRIWYDQ